VVWNEKYWSAATNKGTKNAKSADYDKVYGMPSAEAAAEKPVEGKTFQGLPEDATSPIYFLAPTKAYYTFTIDLEAQTFKWELLENQNPAVYSSMTMTGLADDVALASIGMAGTTGIGTKKHNWYALNVTVDADAMVTFKSGNANWGYGDTDADWTVDDEDNWAKICKQDGAAIKLPAGKYDIYFCDITGAAHFVPAE
jgi:hypothetical protein